MTTEATNKINTLDDLRSAMMEDDPRTLDKHGDWSTDLPTFGGEPPVDTSGVWSWDETRLLVGTCSDDLRFVPRS